MQSSVFNYNTADLAVDGDVKTCAISGWETGGWWKGDLGQAYAVSGVSLIGQKHRNILPSYHALVGPNSLYFKRRIYPFRVA